CHRLVEYQDGIIDDVALQARRIALQRAGADRRATAVGIGASHSERTVSCLDEAARPGDDAGEPCRRVVATSGQRAIAKIYTAVVAKAADCLVETVQIEVSGDSKGRLGGKDIGRARL